jgi:hypothetical protein
MLRNFFQKNKASDLSKEEWILKYGSKELKLRIKNGYSYESLYAKERCQKEFPKFGGFPYSDYFEVSRPSEKALKLLEKVKKNPCFDEKKHTACIIMRNVKYDSVLYGETFERLSEAILVENYLDGYRIWQPILPV